MSSFYFAFGSNLDVAQMRHRCPDARLVGAARLNGHRIAFAGQSAARRGGVATVTPDAAAHVDGLLWRMTREDIESLDAYEGHPRIYRRKRMPVVAANGRVRRADVYALPDGTPLAAPSDGYWGIIVKAYDAYGFDRSGLEQSREEALRACSTMSRVFVYGTLMRGEANHGLLSDAAFVGDATTKATFTLADLGAFPAMLAAGRTAVRGELYDVAPGELDALDRLEGHPRFYERRPIALADGTTAEAYLLPSRQAAGSRVITSGSWRER